MADSPAIKLYTQGAEHFKNGKLDQAIDFFKRSAEVDENFYRAWAYLGMAYAQKEQLDPAIEAYRKCIDLAPAYHKAFNNIGELYRRKGLLDYAAMVFKMATEIEPGLSHYFYNLGITYTEIGMHPQAEEALSNACKLDSKDFDYASELAQAQFTLKKYEAAAGTLGKFLEVRPDHPRCAELKARVTMLKRLVEQHQAAASGSSHTSGIRRMLIDEDTVEGKSETHSVESPAGEGQNDPPGPTG